MLDHKAEAEKVAKGMGDDKNPYTKRDDWRAQAQIHATLYAGEQTARLADALEQLIGEAGILPIEALNAGDLR